MPQGQVQHGQPAPGWRESQSCEHTKCSSLPQRIHQGILIVVEKFILRLRLFQLPNGGKCLTHERDDRVWSPIPQEVGHSQTKTVKPALVLREKRIDGRRQAFQEHALENRQSMFILHLTQAQGAGPPLHRLGTLEKREQALSRLRRCHVAQSKESNDLVFPLPLLPYS